MKARYRPPPHRQRRRRRASALPVKGRPASGAVLALILADAIFQGLAISLVFGLASSTALTVLVIPALHVWLRDDDQSFP